MEDSYNEEQDSDLVSHVLKLGSEWRTKGLGAIKV